MLVNSYTLEHNCNDILKEVWLLHLQLAGLLHHTTVVSCSATSVASKAALGDNNLQSKQHPSVAADVNRQCARSPGLLSYDVTS